MNLKKILIPLEPEELQQIMAIAMDDDARGALEFIQLNLAKKVEKALQPH